MNANVSTELVTVPKGDVLSVFTEPGAVDPILARIRQEIDAFTPPDVSTAKGRDEIKSFAFKITRSKTYLEKLGKELADEMKAVPKKIDASRKVVRDTLDQWSDEVRAPVTAWEEAEQARRDKHESLLAHVVAMADHMHGRSAEDLRGCLDAVNATKIGPHLDEYESDIAAAVERSRNALTLAIAEREKQEAEAAELARLRKEAEERAARDREEELQRKAAEDARIEAERKAAAEIERREAAAKAEREAIEAKALADKEAAERREREQQAAIERAQREAAETEARVKREAEEAKAREADEARRREENRAHCAKINNAAVAAFVAGGIPEEHAKVAVMLIAKRAVPAVSISY